MFLTLSYIPLLTHRRTLMSGYIAFVPLIYTVAKNPVSVKRKPGRNLFKPLGPTISYEEQGKSMGAKQ
jgi:hypothetical protein